MKQKIKEKLPPAREWKRLIAGVLFLLLSAGSLLGLSQVVFPKEIKTTDMVDDSTVRGYRGEPQNSIDVFFVGNSDVYRGVSPMEMYAEHGVTGYVSGQPAISMRESRRLIEDMLKYQKPRVLVLEADALFASENKMPREEKHFANAAQRLSYYKDITQAALKGFSDNTYNNIVLGGLEYVLPILKNHAAWKDWDGMGDGDTSRYRSNSKGFVVNAETRGYAFGFGYMEAAVQSERISARNLGELQRILELCRENDMQLMLLSVPCAGSWSMAKHDAVRAFANENGLLYLDFNEPELASKIGFDWNTDSRDGGKHLNLAGAKKLSPYLGAYLDENFALPDRRTDENYRSWDNDLQIYRTECANAQNEAII